VAIRRERNNKPILVGLIGLWLVVALCLPFVGQVRIGPADVWFGGEPGSLARQVFWQLRVPRLLMAMMAGAALAAAGVAFQAMFRNPLASPFTLGVSSGAGLGAALSMKLAEEGMARAPAVTTAAFFGAMGSVLAVYGVARLRRGFSTNTLLLAGVSIGFICSAVILLVEYVSSEAVTNQTIRWLMGSVETMGYSRLLTACPLVVLGVGILLWHRRELDLLMMGDLVAVGRGVDVRRVRRWVYFGASLMTAGVVAQTGPIAFVGLVVPHVIRLMVGPVHRTLLPAALLGGACFLPACDMVARNGMQWLQGSSLVIPVGVLTSLIGGVFFLGMLLGRRVETPIV